MRKKAPSQADKNPEFIAAVKKLLATPPKPHKAKPKKAARKRRAS